jgi:hypothetical protein
MHNKKKSKLEDAEVIYLQPSNLENIDSAVYEWVDEHLNLSYESHEGFKKVPVVWVGTERVFQVKNNKDIRDKDGALIYPIVTVGRTGFAKDKTKKGAIYAPIPEVSDYRGGAIKITQKINQEKTANFANADVHKQRSVRQLNFVLPKTRKKTIYKHISIPIPVYIDVTYEINIKTQFQTQMNELITPFVTNTGGLNYFPLRKNGHFYEVFIQQDYSSEDNISAMNEEEKIHQTKVQAKVLAYLIGDGSNQAKPINVVRENPVELRITRERATIGEIPDTYDLFKKYRELGE